MEKRNHDQRLWLGVGAIILGILFLASNFHILDYNIRRYIFRWEVLLMFLGVVFFFGRFSSTTIDGKNTYSRPLVGTVVVEYEGKEIYRSTLSAWAEKNQFKPDTSSAPWIVVPHSRQR